MYFSINPALFGSKLEAMKKFTVDGNAPVSIEADTTTNSITLKTSGKVATPTIKIEAAVSRAGVCMVSTDLLLKILRTYSGGEIFIKEFGGTNIKISPISSFPKNSTLSLAMMPSTTTISAFVPGNFNGQVEVGVEDLKYAIKHIAALSKFDKNNQLTETVQIAYENKEVRLAMMSSRGVVTAKFKAVSLKNPGSIIIPYSVLINLPETKDSTMFIQDCSQTAVFFTNEWEIVSCTYAGQFPDYNAILSSTPSQTLGVDTAQLIPIMRRADLLVDQAVGSRVLTLDLDINELSVSVNSSKGSYKDKMPCRWQTTSTKVSFFIEDLIPAVFAVNALCTEFKWISNSIVVASDLPDDDMVNVTCILRQVNTNAKSKSGGTVTAIPDVAPEDIPEEDAIKAEESIAVEEAIAVDGGEYIGDESDSI